jgi:transcriptional regulator with XRE-family HTH domain
LTPEIAFGEVLRELRQAKHFSQEALAQESDLDRTYISLLERGLRQPTLSTQIALARALNVSLVKLMQRVEDKLEANIK